MSNDLSSTQINVSPNQRKKCCNTKLGDVEQKTVSCVALEVQDSAMKQCDTEKYIGDIVSPAQYMVIGSRCWKETRNSSKFNSPMMKWKQSPRREEGP